MCYFVFIVKIIVIDNIIKEQIIIDFKVIFLCPKYFLYTFTNIFRLDFTGENSGEVNEVLEAYEEVMKNNFRLGSKSSKLYNKLDDEGLTTGHFYKGVEQKTIKLRKVLKE